MRNARATQQVGWIEFHRNTTSAVATKVRGLRIEVTMGESTLSGHTPRFVTHLALKAHEVRVLVGSEVRWPAIPLRGRRSHFQALVLVVVPGIQQSYIKRLHRHAINTHCKRRSAFAFTVSSRARKGASVLDRKGCCTRTYKKNTKLWLECSFKKGKYSIPCMRGIP